MLVPNQIYQIHRNIYTKIVRVTTKSDKYMVGPLSNDIETFAPSKDEVC